MTMKLWREVTCMKKIVVREVETVKTTAAMYELIGC